MIRDTLLATGLLFSAYTQLRFPGQPVGPGELCLLAWLGIVLPARVWQLDRPLGSTGLIIAGFWLVIAVAMSVGLMTAYVVGELHVPSLVRHDIMAYLLMASISVAMAIQGDMAIRLERTAKIIVVLGSATLGLQLIEGSGLIDLTRTEPWFYDRLKGWSANANQLGLLCLILTFLSLQVADAGRNTAQIVVGIAGAILPIIVGLLTGSDAFMIVLLLCLLLYAGIRLLVLMTSRGVGPNSAVLLFVGLAIPIGILASAPLVYKMSERWTAVDQVGTSEKIGAVSQDIDERTQLWQKALEKSGRYWMLGLGPGPHLERLGHLRHPRREPIPSFEAHNTLFDLLLQGGLIGAVGLLSLGALAFVGNVKAKRFALATMLVGIVLFGATHFIIRHPMLWFVIVISLLPVTAHATRRA